MHDGAVVHGPVGHRAHVVGGAHHAVEVTLHDAHALAVLGDPASHKYGGNDRHRDTEVTDASHHEDGAERDKCDAELKVAREHERRHDCHEHRAERAAERDHEIEPQVRRIRLHAREFAVAHHASDEEPDEVKRRGAVQVERWNGESHQRHERHQRADENGPDIPARVVEGQDEADEIEGERQNPQERHARDVLRHVVRDCEQHHRPHGGKRQPLQLRSRRQRCRWRGLVGLRSIAVHGKPGRACAEEREGREDERPAPAQRLQVKRRLEQRGNPSASSEARLERANRRYGTVRNRRQYHA